MNSHKNIVLILISLMVSALSFLAGYMVFSPKSHSHAHCNHAHHSNSESEHHVGTVLLSMDGKTVISTGDFETYVNSLIAINPQISSLLSVVPGMKENIFNGLKSIKIIEKWATDSGLEDNQSFIKELEQTQNFIKAELLRKHFQQMLAQEVVPSEDEVRSYYETHKTEIPELLLQEGGYKASALLCSSVEEHRLLLKELEQNPAQFRETAAAKNIATIDFGTINSRSHDIDPLIKEKIVTTDVVPAVYGIEKEDGTCLIIFVEASVSPMYRSFEDVQQNIAQLVINQKMQTAFIEKIEALAQQYKVQEYKELLQETAVSESADMSVEDALALFDEVASEDEIAA